MDHHYHSNENKSNDEMPSYGCGRFSLFAALKQQAQALFNEHEFAAIETEDADECCQLREAAVC